MEGRREGVMQAFDCWWKESAVYQIYPRSFQDSNHDGIGDIEGIIRRLDYLQWLGVGAIWLSPIYRSPMKDFGYDISDYRSLDPVFGTIADVDRLLEEAHAHNIRIILDMVLNHTSDQHAWFLESASSRENPKRDFYIWRDMKGRRYPNNWYGTFGGRAWTLDRKTGQCYLHSFLKEQPDLNWHNDAVVAALFAELEFWLEKGVDGFRLDVINLIMKDVQLRNNPLGWGGRPRPYDLQRHLYDRNLSGSHERLKTFRTMLERYPQRMLVGEIMVDKPGEPEIAASYLGTGEDELHLAFDFSGTWLPWKADAWKRAAQRWERAIPKSGWPCWVLSNHDTRRSITRWGGNIGRARIAALFLLTQRGTPFLYYGEEIGMRDHPVRRSEMQDPLGLRYWPFHRGRDGSRRPMRWDGSMNHGFSDTTPWLPFDGQDHTDVFSQKEDRSSLLHVYRDLLHMRNHDHALRCGKTQWIEIEDSPKVLAYTRDAGTSRRLILLNFTDKEVFFRAEPVQKAMESEVLRVLYSTIPGDTSVEGTAQKLSLQPYQGMICTQG